jgi:ferric-dicitrate binding protein FerR (iron transport regulator)
MRILLTILIIIPAVSSADTVIGKLVQSEGMIKRTNINCFEKDCNIKSRKINPGERIKTARGSSARILLKDGTAIILYENSDLIINWARLSERDKPTEIFLEKGKIQVIQKNSFLDTSLIVKTHVSIIKSVNSELRLVSGTDETAIFVYSGEAGFAGINPSKDEAFILKSGDESFVRKDDSPAAPVIVDRILRTSWLGRHFLSEDSRRVLVYRKNGLTADWPFIKSD